jgi:hypothetical protein
VQKNIRTHELTQVNHTLRTEIGQRMSSIQAE